MRDELVTHFFTDEEDRRIFNREMLILKTTELISIVMKNKKISKSLLAKLLKKSKGYISQLLSGETNMTLGTLADVMTSLKEEVELVVNSQSKFTLDYPVQEVRATVVTAIWDQTGSELFHWDTHQNPQSHRLTATNDPKSEFACSC